MWFRSSISSPLILNSSSEQQQQQQRQQPSLNKNSISRSNNDLNGKSKSIYSNNNSSRTIVRIREASLESLEEDLNDKNHMDRNLRGVNNKKNNFSEIFRSNQPLDSVGNGFDNDIECNCGRNASIEEEEEEEEDLCEETGENTTCICLSRSSLTTTSSTSSEEEEEEKEEENSIGSLPSLSHSIRTPLFDDSGEEEEEDDDEAFSPLSYSPQSEDSIKFLYSSSISPTRSFPNRHNGYTLSRRRKSISTIAEFDPLLSPPTHTTFDLNSNSNSSIMSTTSTNSLESNTITTTLAEVVAPTPPPPTSSALTKSLLKLVRLPNLSLPKLPPLLHLTSTPLPLPTSLPTFPTSNNLTIATFPQSLLDSKGESKVEESWSCELHEFEYEYECERGWDWGRNDRDRSIQGMSKEEKDCTSEEEVEEVDLRSPPLSPTTTTISLPSLPPLAATTTTTTTKSQLKQQQRLLLQQQQQSAERELHYTYQPPRLISNQRHLLMLSLEISMIHSGKILFPLRQRAVTILNCRGSPRGGTRGRGSFLKFEVMSRESDGGSSLV